MLRRNLTYYKKYGPFCYSLDSWKRKVEEGGSGRDPSNLGIFSVYTFIHVENEVVVQVTYYASQGTIV